MIPNIRNDYFGRAEQRRELDLVQKLNAMHSQNLQQDPQLEARIKAFEMAYRMQIEATDAFDLEKEPQSVRTLYGDTAAGAAAADRPPARRARRALRPGVGRRLGSPRGPRNASAGERRRNRHRRRRPADRPEAARPVRPHAGHLGRRVRPLRDPRPQRQRQPGARSQQRSVQRLARGRRREGWHGVRRDRRVRREGGARTRCTSTTCTRRFSICSASITPG